MSRLVACAAWRRRAPPFALVSPAEPSTHSSLALMLFDALSLVGSRPLPGRGWRWRV